MLRISNIKIYKDITDEEVLQTIIKKYKISKNDITEWHISKKSIDARKKEDVHYSYCIDICVKSEEKLLKNKDISLIKKLEQPQIQINLSKSIRPVIVGAGPSGLFAALTFIKYGYKPIVIEQGEKVEERKKSVDILLVLEF